jgi:N utilization substance protein B
MLKKVKSKRRKAREKALQILFALSMNPDAYADLITNFYADMEGESEIEFSRSLVRKVIANEETLDEYIKEKASNWELERIALIDRILMRMGIAEILYFPDIPPKVSINEMIEISKEYSTSKSGKFINGILDSILNDLKKSGKLNKFGRGLIDETLDKKQNKN